VPLGFSIAYPFVKGGDGSWPPQYYAAPLVLAALAFLVWKKWRTRPDLLLGLALYLLPLVVMLPFRTVGSFELRSDRYVYLSCLGVFFVAGVLLENLRPALRMAVLGVAALLLGGLAFWQTAVWKDGVAMFENCVSKTPESALCQCNLAYNELISLDFQSAVQHYSAALKSDATYIEAYNGRGQAYLNLRQIQPAYDDFDKAIKAGLSTPKLFLNRGKCAVMLGKPQEAVPDLSKSIELEPREAETWYFRGVAQEKTGQPEAALSDYAKAAELRPGYVEALTNRGVLLLNTGRLEEALRAFDAGIAAAPNLPMLHNNRANAHYQLGHYAEAVQDATKALGLNPKYLPAYQIRGNAYLKLGQPDKAQADFKSAAALK
ncbi:MAG TPA: tetratricopeptide repeat protein, partial [Saprospiraceae bacterium]|nr:tetratricopeptide repeat protein [Saprospiraceae bacterium]